MYFKLLLLVHIAGAIVGFGPTFAFGIMGSRVETPDLQPGRRLVVMDLIYRINRYLVTPVGFATQPLSGILLIFKSGRNHGFFQHEWLVVALSLYVVMILVIVLLDGPGFTRMFELAKDNRTDDPEYARLGKRGAITGPLLGLIVLTIIVLMVLKPGD